LKLLPFFITSLPHLIAPFMKTILLVEDEILLRDGVQETLEVNGFSVIGAADGIEALDWLEKTEVALVITDLVMPNMNGVEFIEQLRVKYPKLPVIVASGSPDSVQNRLGITNIQVPGASACITKPFKGKDLVSLVEKVLSQQAA
jgi:CheY-like chemotaxis protein